MNRFLTLSSSVLILASGCGSTDETPRKRECELEVLNLSSCDRSGLGAIQAQGIWNMDLTFDDGFSSPSAIRFSPVKEEALIAGLPISEQRVESDLFLLASNVEGREGGEVRYLFAGCSSSGPGRVQGQFRRCVNGTKDLEGTFQATRITRRAEETEAAGVQLVSEIALPRGSAVDLFVSGSHAYVSALEAGVYIYDVSQPEAPRKVAEIVPQSDTWHQTWVRGQTLYIASAQRGIILYDVTDPAAPRQLKSVPDKGADVRALYFDGDRLYAASPAPNAEVFVYNVANPTEPTLLTRYLVEDSDPRQGDRPMDVVVREGKLYVSHWTYGLTVSDVANPSKPKLLGRFSYPDATTRTAVVGTFGNRTLAFEAGEDWGAHLRVLDVSTPANITQVGEFKLRPEVSIRALALSGNRLYVAHYQDGLRILDVSNPSELRQVGYYNTWRETDARRGASFYEGLSGLRVPGNGYLYAAETSRGLLIFREVP